MAKYFGSGVPLSAGFDLSCSRPLDSRLIVSTMDELNNMPDVQKYLGMIVFVESTLVTYQLIGDNNWRVFGTNADSIIENLHKVATTGDYNDLENIPNTQIVASESEPAEEDKVLLWIDLEEDNEI